MMKIIYVGQDLSYFNTIQNQFAEVAKDEEVEFQVLWTEDWDRFHQLSANIVDELPNIVFLDYSSHPQKVMTLARTLPRLFKKGPTIIGLWDAHATEALLLESLTLGVPFTHFKSPEVHDVIQQALFLHRGGEFPEGAFAKAEIMKSPVTIEASSLFRVGFMTEDYIHVEHNFLPPENEFTLKHSLKGFPVTEFKVLRRIDRNFYYHKEYCSDYGYVHLSESKKINIDDYKSKGPMALKKAQYQVIEQQERIERSKKGVATFIEKSTTRNTPKRTRLLVIDEELEIVKQAPKPLDDYPYSIRFYRTLECHENIISRILPGIVVYQCQKDSSGELEALVKAVKEEKGLSSFIFVFRTPYSSEDLQKKYDYDHLMAWNNAFDFEQMLGFCETYQKKLGREKSHDQESSYHNKEKRFYVAKDSIESFLEYHFKIELRSVCEAWSLFESREDFALWSQIRVKEPVSFALTIIEKEPTQDGFVYRGIIHGIGEAERAGIRRAVNSYIFREIESEKYTEEP